MPKKKELVNLTVTAVYEAKRSDGSLLEGIGKNNKPWKLWDIKANDEKGNPYPLYLKSFEKFEIGKTGPFVLETDPQYPKSGNVSEPSQKDLDTIRLDKLEKWAKTKGYAPEEEDEQTKSGPDPDDIPF